MNGFAVTDSTTTAPAFDVSGVAASGPTVTLQVDGVTVLSGEATTKASSGYDIQVPFLDSGTHSLAMVATDAAGNVSQPSAAAITVTSPVAPRPVRQPSMAC